MGLTGPGLAVLLVGLTVALPALVVWGPRHEGRQTPLWSATRWRLGVRPAPRRWSGAVARWAVLVLAQLVAVATSFVLVNDWLRFYPTWQDLVGRPAPAPVIENRDERIPTPGPGGGPTTRVPTPSGATLVTMPVNGAESGARGDVLVWLPPGYDTELAGRRLPVLVFMPGQPGSPQGVYSQFDIDRAASASIREGRTQPFLVVVPPIMVDPPRNTECLDVPNGPQSRTWLARDVRRAVLETFRVPADPGAWNLAGYSTGGYCAAMLLMEHRDRFGAAASLGGYYHPWADTTTGDLFGGDTDKQRAADVLERLRSEHPQPTKLLMVSSQGDPGSWGGQGGQGDSREAIEAAKRWPGTASMVLDKGGHGFRTYAPSLPEVLAWLGRTNGL